MNLWRRMFGPRRLIRSAPERTPVTRLHGGGFASFPYERAGGHTGTKDGETMNPPASTPSGSTARPHPPRTFSAGALRTAEVFANLAHEFWTGEYAKRDRHLHDKIERSGIGNGHMLTAIWTLLSAEVPSEIKCPNCLATIRAPYAEELKK